MSILLDASIALAWCFPDEDDEYAGHVLDALAADNAVVPAVWSFEVANGLVSGERRRRISRDEMASAASVLSALDFTELAISVEEIGPIAHLALAHGLSAYDASYLHLALREGLPLATRDRRLRVAAEAAGCTLFE